VSYTIGQKKNTSIHVLGHVTAGERDIYLKYSSFTVHTAVFTFINVTHILYD